MLNNDDFNLLNTLFPAWQQLTTKQQQIIYKQGICRSHQQYMEL